jgi:hypothetical protein
MPQKRWPAAVDRQRSSNATFPFSVKLERPGGFGRQDMGWLAHQKVEGGIFLIKHKIRALSCIFLHIGLELCSR